MENADNLNRWISAEDALRAVSRYLASNNGFDDESANRKAAILLFERLASGDLYASPKGLLLPYVSEATNIQRWYGLSFTKASGAKERCQIESGPGSSILTIPVEFWHPFQRGYEGAVADWGAGDFHFNNYKNSVGAWSGRVRNVYFDRIDLPASWLAQSWSTYAKVGQLFLHEDGNRLSETLKASMPASATHSEREHEDLAHAAAKIVRETRCSVAHAIQRVRHQGEADEQAWYLAAKRKMSEQSIEWAIRRSYNRMYDLKGLIKG